MRKKKDEKTKQTDIRTNEINAHVKRLGINKERKNRLTKEANKQS